ncbi:MAG: hypothetical protein ISS38_01900 [Candidatus Cloacimonetes bacterium]|nr:hypothetical protein [Candidatus Cloacimonadota bacterium]
MLINEDNSGVEYSVSMSSFQAGIGFEKLFGFKKNKGWGLEIGYQYGSADYEITIDNYYGGGSETYEYTYDLPPLFIGVSFAYYFGK